MKETHTILIPAMMPFHFELISRILNQNGYKTEVLATNHSGIVEQGLRSVHNDTCYPALLVIGQFLDALQSGKYDTDKVALMITQTGGGCRASNYISLLRKALRKHDLGHIPVISLNFQGLDKQSGFSVNRELLLKMFYSVLYGDLLMWVYNQCVPYELGKDRSLTVANKWIHRLGDMDKKQLFRLKDNCYAILDDFGNVLRDTSQRKPRVGIVGEIYVKYAPLGNNELEKILIEHGVEVVNTGLLDFCLYNIYNGIYDRKIYGGSLLKNLGARLVLKYAIGKQRKMITAIRRHKGFRPPTDFRKVIKMGYGYLDHAVKMGEGWLLTAEMAELLHSGVSNIVAAQPFGCLPNHIVAKGMARKIKENFPHANIAAIDYDPGASRVNQENRLKLMLAVARRQQGTVQSVSYATKHKENVNAVSKIQS